MDNTMVMEISEDNIHSVSNVIKAHVKQIVVEKKLLDLVYLSYNGSVTIMRFKVDELSVREDTAIRSKLIPLAKTLGPDHFVVRAIMDFSYKDDTQGIMECFVLTTKDDLVFTGYCVVCGATHYFRKGFREWLQTTHTCVDNANISLIASNLLIDMASENANFENKETENV